MTFEDGLQLLLFVCKFVWINKQLVLSRHNSSFAARTSVCLFIDKAQQLWTPITSPASVVREEMNFWQLIQYIHVFLGLNLHI